MGYETWKRRTDWEKWRRELRDKGEKKSGRVRELCRGGEEEEGHSLL